MMFVAVALADMLKKISPMEKSVAVAV